MYEYYEHLAQAIIVQAVNDYRDALAAFYLHPREMYRLRVQELEEFFYSDFYSVLTKVDADYILKRVRAEVHKGVNR